MPPNKTPGTQSIVMNMIIDYNKYRNFISRIKQLCEKRWKVNSTDETWDMGVGRIYDRYFCLFLSVYYRIHMML